MTPKALVVEELLGFIFKTPTEERKVCLFRWQLLNPICSWTMRKVGTFRRNSWLLAHTKHAREWARTRRWSKSTAVWFSTYSLGWSLHFPEPLGNIHRNQVFFCLCTQKLLFLRLKNQCMSICGEGWVRVSAGSLRALPGPAMFLFSWAQSPDIWRITILKLKKPCMSSSSEDAEWGLDCPVDRTSLVNFSEADNKRPKKI